MLKRLITLLVLLGLVYMGYRIMDPIGAQTLLSRVQSRFGHDDTILQPVVVQQTPVPLLTGSTLTGSNSTGSAIVTGIVSTPPVPTVVVIPSPTTTTGQSHSTGTSSPNHTTPVVSPKPAKPTTSSALSAQDMQDLQHLLNAIVE